MIWLPWILVIFDCLSCHFIIRTRTQHYLLQDCMCAQRRLRSDCAVWSVLTEHFVGSQGSKISSDRQQKTNQHVEMYRLIWAFAGHTCNLVVKAVPGLLWSLFLYGCVNGSCWTVITRVIGEFEVLYENLGMIIYLNIEVLYTAQTGQCIRVASWYMI